MNEPQRSSTQSGGDNHTVPGQLPLTAMPAPNSAAPTAVAGSPMSLRYCQYNGTDGTSSNQEGEGTKSRTTQSPIALICSFVAFKLYMMVTPTILVAVADKKT
jgi:hypothetical protein